MGAAALVLAPLAVRCCVCIAKVSVVWAALHSQVGASLITWPGQFCRRLLTKVYFGHDKLDCRTYQYIEPPTTHKIRGLDNLACFNIARKALERGELIYPNPFLALMYALIDLRAAMALAGDTGIESVGVDGLLVRLACGNYGGPCRICPQTILPDIYYLYRDRFMEICCPDFRIVTISRTRPWMSSFTA